MTLSDPDIRGDGASPGATSGVVDEEQEARKAVFLGLWVSAIRCLLTYIIGPGIGLLGVAAFGVVALALHALGIVTSVNGAVRLRRAGNGWWRAYAALAVVIVGLGISSLLSYLHLV